MRLGDFPAAVVAMVAGVVSVKAPSLRPKAVVTSVAIPGSCG